MTSPYAMYQFWLNTDDADVVDRLKIFTFLPRTEIERLAEAVASEPFRREAQRALAWEATTLVHGVEATEAAIAASQALFGQGDLSALDADTLSAALRELPNASAASTTTVAELLVTTGLTPSLSAARRAVGEGGVYLNNEKVGSAEATLEGSLLADRFAVLRRGKKTLAGIFVE
jgi:tyrosyl-tRNA synthetase